MPSITGKRWKEEKNSHPSIMSLICRLKQSDYAKVQLHMMNRFSRTLNKHLNGYFLAMWHILLYHQLSSRNNSWRVMIVSCCTSFYNRESFKISLTFKAMTHLTIFFSYFVLTNLKVRVEEISRNFTCNSFTSPHLFSLSCRSFGNISLQL